MRVGVITDIHANLPALRAALAAMEADGCEHIIHTGDAIGIGPHPREVLELLREHEHISFTMGNHDEWFAFGVPDPAPAWMSAGELTHHQWVHRRLNPSLRTWVTGWPHHLDRVYGSTSVRFQHYAINNGEYGPVSRENVAAELDATFQPTADIVFFGHHHPQADIQGRARYINPGALGCHPSLGARYAVLQINNDGSLDVRLQAVTYDASQVYKDMMNREVPEADFLTSTFLD